MALEAGTVSHGVTRGPEAEIAYETRGQGPPLVLIAGFATSHAIWEPQLDAWSQERTLVLLDNRKVGRSRGRGAVPWVRLMAADVLAVLDELGIERASLCGTSMGGFIAQTVAVRHPERVDRLVLTSTAPQRPVPRPGRGPGRMLFADAFARRHPETVAYWTHHARAARVQVCLAQAAAIMAFDLRRKVGKITAPTLVLHGSADRIIPVHHGRWLAAHIPGAQLIVYSGAGHALTIERTAEYNRDVLRWLKTPAGQQSGSRLPRP